MTATLTRDPPLAGPRPSPAATRDRRFELGLGIVVIAVPLAFVPKTSAPFLDVKLVLLFVGCLALWAGRRPGTRFALPATAWIAASGLAGVLGVDPWWSLTGPENSGNGVLLLGACAFLLVSATGTPAALRERVPVWLVGSATAASAVAVAYRLLPDVFPYVGDLGFSGGTIGNPVFVAAFAATGIAAAVGLARMRPALLVPVLVILSSALAVSTKRVGWVALAAGLAVALWRMRPPRRRALLIVSVVAATLLGWTALDAAIDHGDPLSGAGRFTELAMGSAQTRVVTASAVARGWTERPVFGWGPGNTWPAYLSSVMPEELGRSERGVHDAHNLFLEAWVTTGIVGLAAFVVLVVLVVRCVRRGPRSLGWAAGAAVALAVAHLLQPINVTLTPMLFLLAGLACGPREERAPPRVPRIAGLGAAVLLAGGLILSLGSFAASTLEHHGRTYASEWSLRAAHRIAPGRVSAAKNLALHLALDGRFGDDRAAAEAIELAEATVRLHPWHPVVRLLAADVHLILRDDEGAAAWIDRHGATFPADELSPLPASTRFAPASSAEAAAR